LPATFCELADAVFVTAPDDVRLNVTESKALGTDLFDKVRETVVVDVSLTVGRALKSIRSMMPLRSGFASAMARRCVVSCSPILSDNERMIDQTASSGFSGSSGR
jgi:hypothetical protein